MRWQDLGRSANIGTGSGGGGMGGLALGGGGIGALAIAAVVFFLTGDPGTAIRAGSAVGGMNGGGGQGQVAQGCPEGDQACNFTSAILKGTEDVWTAEFARRGSQYEAPQLISFDGQFATACGTGQSAMGPFYCPADRNVYIDTSFYDELGTRFGAAGDFANAYVVAHEVGHHIQTLTGASEQVARVRAQGDKRAANLASVRLELQADCYAGVWANRANQLNMQRNGRPLLEPGEEREALQAASAIGDDRLQRQSQGRVVPDSFTHGSSEQRVRWFTAGFQAGQMEACDTFSIPASRL
jgi:hypothetical protein